MNSKRKRFKNIPFHLMLLPATLLAFIFYYIPMSGILMAFQDYKSGRGFTGFFTSPFVGLKHYKYLFGLDSVWQILQNTVSISLMKIILGILVPIIVAILLNEVSSNWRRRSIQTCIYLPNFLSWVVLGGILIDILSPGDGIVNRIIEFFGGQSVNFLSNEKIFPYTLVVSDIWQKFGFNTIVYIAAITGIDTTLYEAARMDGAGHIRQMWHITLPGMSSIIILMSLLSLGNLLNAGFDQVFNLINPAVYRTGEILDTYVYKLGLVDARYSVATAAGLIKSVISVVLISLSYWLAYKFADYRIF